MPFTKLKELLVPLKAYDLRAPEELEIKGLADESGRVESGFLFAALRGGRTDGHRYAADALSRGAVCVLCEEPPQEDVPCVVVPDSREALGQMAAAFYGYPDRELKLVGVTGTNGKTTTTSLLRQLLQSAGEKTGLIGTNRIETGGESLPARRTTPGSLDLQRLLARMAAEGCTHAVMEVSSHALIQRRTAGLHFDVGVFTNLTQDHLDYHGTMERYCEAKARLFSQCALAVVNGDDPWKERVLQYAACPVLTFGQGMDNDIVGWHPRYENGRVCFTVSDDTEHVETFVPIPGTFSLYNALAALASARALGVPLRAAAAALERCGGVRGRCEVVPTGTDYTVIIDYAHTPDGLKKILEAVCGFAENRVLLVFGCGGDRDPTKRARMGRIASALADAVVLTSDNPRSEPPYAILHDVLSGMSGSRTPFAVLEDRREAIAYALSHARRGDVVLLAGKGHETVQIVGGEERPFDEREVVCELLKRTAGTPA